MKYFKFDSFKTQSTLAKRTVKKKKGQKEEEIEKKTKTKEKSLNYSQTIPTRVCA